jgi:hypothetical protein
MELTGWLLRHAVPHALVVAEPGFTSARLAVERELRLRGWPEVSSPADADLLVVCAASDEHSSPIIQLVWDQFPSPRALVCIASAPDAASRLDDARLRLLDLEAVRADAAGHEATVPEKAAGGRDEDMGRMDVDAQGTGDMDMGMDMDGMDMDMPMPGGIPMADRAADRDGLKLDQLHLTLGPALSNWPAGLVVRLALQGDIVQTAEVQAADAQIASSFWSEAGSGCGTPTTLAAAAAADSLQRLLIVAGWQSAALTGRWFRDELLAGVAPVDLDPHFLRWVRRVRRSRTLLWSTAGLGLVAPDAPASLSGDVTDRWVRWVDEIAHLLLPGNSTAGMAESMPVSTRGNNARAAIAALPELLVGQELTAVRLIVASLDPDLEALNAPAVPAIRGDDR